MLFLANLLITCSTEKTTSKPWERTTKIYNKPRLMQITKFTTSKIIMHQEHKNTITQNKLKLKPRSVRLLRSPATKIKHYSISEQGKVQGINSLTINRENGHSRISVKMHNHMKWSFLLICNWNLQCTDTVGWASRRTSGMQKIEWWGAGVVICLQQGADHLHMVQLMPLPPNHLLLH